MKPFSTPGKAAIGCLAALWLAVLALQVQAQEGQDTPKGLTITQAVMSEEIKDYEPYNIAAVFSLAMGKVFCFTAFDNVTQDMYIYHSWYRHDRLITTRRLSLRTPAWSVFSTIQLRQADIGPWRVEVRDPKNRVLKILKFSITE